MIKQYFIHGYSFHIHNLRKSNLLILAEKHIFRIE